jgi:glycerol kinase
LLVGTTDTWILWNLSGRRLFLTDTTTASRTSLLDLRRLAWDPDLLELFEIPPSLLPEVVPSTGQFGSVELPGWPVPVPVAGLAVDQQAALFSHACLELGMVKATYGTGTFVLMQIGPEPRLSQHGLVTTVAWALDGRASYALDGGIYTTGAAVQWLVDGLRLLERPEQSAEVARSVPDSDDVYVVPAFSGLAAPYWDPRARGLIIGLTRGTSWAHVVRATLEGIAFRVRDVVEAMEADAGAPLHLLRVDGGPTRNEFLMQFQADVLGVLVEVAETTEATARGAALLAGLGIGWWTTSDVAASWRPAARYEPAMGEAERQHRYARWRRAVERARDWAE